MAWQIVVLFLVSTVLSYLLRPKPQAPKPTALGDIDFPIASSNAPIPVLFGTRLITGPNVIWYGDLRTTAIKSEGGKK